MFLSCFLFPALDFHKIWNVSWRYLLGFFLRKGKGNWTVVSCRGVNTLGSDCVKYVHSCCWALFDSHLCWQNRHLWTHPKDVNAVPLSHSAVFHPPLPVVIFPTDAWDCTKKKRFEFLLCGRNKKYFIPVRSGILVTSFNIPQDALICLKQFFLALQKDVCAAICSG